MIPINIYEKPKVLKTKAIALVLSFKVVVMVSLICFCKNYIFLILITFVTLVKILTGSKCYLTAREGEEGN